MNGPEFDDSNRIYQAPGVYTTPESQQVHILYGGEGAPDGPGHGHYVYGVPQDREFHRGPAGL